MVDLPFANLDFGQVQVQIQVQPITTENFTEHLKLETSRIKDLVRNRNHIAPSKAVVIVDGSVNLVPPTQARKLQAEWLKENRDLLRLVTHEIGFVLPNPFLRGFVSAVFYLVPLPVPSNTHASLDEAIRWAIKEAKSIGGLVDESLINLGSVAVERARAETMIRTGQRLHAPPAVAQSREG